MAIIASSERSGLPQVSLQIPAQTAKKTLIWNLSLSSSQSVEMVFTMENGYAFLRLQAPIVSGPAVTRIPSSVFNVVAGYDQTTPIIIGPASLITKATQALRRAEGWGWSKTLKNIKRIEIGSVRSRLYLQTARAVQTLATLGQSNVGAVAPPPDLVFGLPGVVFLDENFADSYSEVAPVSWELAIRLIHESLHHAYYSVGYSVEITWWNLSPAITAVALYNFLAHDQENQHLGTTPASVVNASSLGQQMFGSSTHWRNPGHDVSLPDVITGSPHVEPDLRAKSVVDITQAPHLNFGTRLDDIESILGLWGIGGWIDQFCPPLNYTTSGVSPASGQFVLDLSQTDGSLAWQIAGQDMVRTVDKWAEYKKINNNPNIKSTATSMGMIALMAKLGLVPKK